MTGWGGSVSIQAMRYCVDYKIAVIILDWNRTYMSSVLPAPKRSIVLILAQATADELQVAKALVLAKVAEHCRVKAVDASTFRHAQHRLSQATSVENVLIAEAQPARFAWADRRVVLQWREAGPVPNSWKNPYGLRRRIASTPKWKARGPKNATDPINSLLQPRICSNDRKAHSRHRCARVVAGPWVSSQVPELGIVLRRH